MIFLRSKSSHFAFFMSLALASSITSTVARAESNPFIAQNTVSQTGVQKINNPIIRDKIDVLTPGKINGADPFKEGFADFKEKPGFADFTKPVDRSSITNPSIIQRPSAVDTFKQIQTR
ncbi:hypothetical protein F7734_17095 [Scytonema sp. UIC 10036]|uniref:hypothetical protein n=1 Tax=Scytonema sp. UIC 10036 TaxID=2304196 RepID=UPI0012DA6309|nr:hypothetical protein [Scytonema sp. UIC 10036]MUG94014.1 hypothetical protein [Scytonema sp. UIC 10036]